MSNTCFCGIIELLIAKTLNFYLFANHIFLIDDFSFLADEIFDTLSKFDMEGIIGWTLGGNFDALMFLSIVTLICLALEALGVASLLFCIIVLIGEAKSGYGYALFYFSHVYFSCMTEFAYFYALFLNAIIDLTRSAVWLRSDNFCDCSLSCICIIMSVVSGCCFRCIFSVVFWFCLIVSSWGFILRCCLVRSWLGFILNFGLIWGSSAIVLCCLISSNGGRTCCCAKSFVEGSIDKDGVIFGEFFNGVYMLFSKRAISTIFHVCLGGSGAFFQFMYWWLDFDFIGGV